MGVALCRMQNLDDAIMFPHVPTSKQQRRQIATAGTLAARSGCSAKMLLLFTCYQYPLLGT
jgi:hypothetical protein